MSTITTAAEVRSHLQHPIVDADGHIVECLPVLIDHIRKVAGDDVADRFGGTAITYSSRSSKLLERSPTHGRAPTRGVAMAPWWALPTNARDRATGFLPGLLAERLDEIGIDFAVLYSSVGLACVGHPDTAIRTGACRGLNHYLADVTDGYQHLMTATAVVPTTTPDEAIAELEYAVQQLGFRSVMFNDLVLRPADGGGGVARCDLLALDSDYDYDPLWARCVDLGVAVTVHSGAQGYGLRTSSSRYMFNHIGNFGAAGHAFAKAVFFGGVTNRFPTLNFAFLEGGVAWGVMLLCDLVDRFAKRGGENIDRLNPEHLDLDEWNRILDQYGGARFADPGVREAMAAQSDNPPVEIDDYRACGVTSAADIGRHFDNFYFGCEADDPTISWAYAKDVNPGGTCLRPVLGSDLGHWDVSNMLDVLPEAYELVDHGHLDHRQFRDFSCDNAIRLHGLMNPKFFDGTAVEHYASTLIAEEVALRAQVVGR